MDRVIQVHNRQITAVSTSWGENAWAMEDVFDVLHFLRDNNQRRQGTVLCLDRKM